VHVETFNDSQGPRTLQELLLHRAVASGEKLAYRFLEDGEDVSETITYAEFAARTLALAAALQQRIAPRERVLLLFPSGVDYMVAFFACVCADIIAVPLFPPRGNKPNLRLEAVVQDCTPRAALTSSAQIARIVPAMSASPGLAALELLAIDELTATQAVDWARPVVTSETIAFLQYTSGSTGQPKGVMVSHGNVIANERMIQAGIRSDADSNFVTWLPIYHDMGMIGNMLQPFWLASECTFMAPVAFLQRPARWLHAVSRFRAHVSGGPNFAYDLCVDKISEAQKEGLDLSAWQVAFTGAEPIRHPTLTKFATTFKSCGLSSRALYPCYGMAETTLIVAGGPAADAPVIKWVDRTELTRGQIVDATPDDGQALVGCGQPLAGQSVRIVDPITSTPCAGGEVGEIWLRGPNVASGYWDRPDTNIEQFRARLIGSDEGPFFRTGDLGFVDGGQLYITGRIKDVIIVNGANHYPHDIEATVEAADPSINQAGIAAFGVYDATGERVVVLAEVARTSLRKFDPKALVGRIRQQVFEQREVVLDDILLVRPGTLPKSSSGKIQRGQCRALYLANDLDLANADGRAMADAA
jgi:acyl-CoA synthetase (AMP-forming)/AMP-acid ligase II